MVHTSPDGEAAELRSVLDASGIAYTIDSTPMPRIPPTS